MYLKNIRNIGLSQLYIALVTAKPAFIFPTEIKSWLLDKSMSITFFLFCNVQEQWASQQSLIISILNLLSWSTWTVVWVCMFEEKITKRFNQTRNLCKGMQLGNEKWVIYRFVDQNMALERGSFRLILDVHSRMYTTACCFP